MRSIAVLLLLLAGLPSAAYGVDPASLEQHVRRNPCDYSARRDLVVAQAGSGDFAAAYYHAAWLAWLGPREYADSAEGIAFIRSRLNRDRSRLHATRSTATVTAAVQARRLLFDTCLNGAVAQQTTRLRRDISDLAERAEETAAAASRNDPVVRMALADLALTLDDVLVFEGRNSTKRSRVRTLRAAASRAEAAAAMVPEAPGPRRLLAVIRSRLAELDGIPDLWDLAIAEAEFARQIDPSDAYLSELLWTLHLRAGHWERAKVWQKRVEAAAEASGSE